MPGTFDGRLAFASVTFPAPGAPTFRTQSGDFASVAVAGGVTRLTLQDPISPYQGFANLTIRSATGGYATVVDWTNAYLDVETLDTTGAAAELDFDLTVVAQPVSFVVPPAPPPPPPGPPTTDLISWWRADDLALPNGADVFSWTDRSGAGIVLLPLSVDRPSYNDSTVGLNGQPSVYFENRNEALRALNPPNYPVGSGAFTVYAVHIPILASTSPVMTMIGWGRTFISGKSMSFSMFPGAPWSLAADAFAAGTPSYTANGNPQIASISSASGQNMADATILVDGTVPALIGGGSAIPWDINNPCEEVRMGGLVQNNGGWYNGNIAEVLIYRKAHSLAERAQTLAYLSTRYGIPVP